MSESSPYVEAWRTRDAAAFSKFFAPDIVLESPIIRRPFRGADDARRLFEVLFTAFDEFEIVDRFTSDDREAVFWRGTVHGRTITGVDRIRSARSGIITEIEVYIRPLVAIAWFADAIGPPLARRRAPWRGAVTKIVGSALPALMRLIDATASRLAN